jgi:Succinate dehydrogenase/fumarate reductase, flavoprotein subunit
MKQEKTDILIIGFGVGGMIADLTAAGMGKKFNIIHKTKNCHH